MNVAFVYDPGNRDGTRGGAELAMDEFRDAAPDGVTITTPKKADTVVIGNCVKVNDDRLIPELEGKRVIRFHHDLARDESDRFRDWLNDHAEHIFTSPYHRELYGGHDDAHLIPPTVNLEVFKPNRATRRHGKREGIVTVGSWQGPGKGGHLVSETVYRHGETVDCYGPGAFRPYGQHVIDKGVVDHKALPAILATYEQFVFLPTVPEPFGRCVAEAWAAGCEVMTNNMVGSKWWIENEPDKLWTAAEDFWGLACS